MNKTDEIRKISCYAVLQSGYAGENFLLPHMRLVLYLIYKKGYRKIEASTLVSDFFDEYKYTIDYFAMQQILSIAVTNGYLTKKRNFKTYTSTDKIEEFHRVDQDISASESSFHFLAHEFKNFVESLGANVSYSVSEAESIVIAYVNAQKLEHISGHINGVSGDLRVDYLFGKFVYWIKDNKPDSFEYLNHLVTGSILADCLTFNEVLKNDRSLNGFTAILDSSIVFMILGIDIVDRSPYYTELVKTLIGNGAQVAMFAHSYNEMQRVIIGAASWVENPFYDCSLASITTDYFRSIHATRDNVEEYSLNLKTKICNAGITIMDVDYLPLNYQYQQDEIRLYDMIVEKYRQANAYFNEITQRDSIELDARSIAHIYMLRKALLPRHIADAKYLFITTNRSLVSVAKEYNNSVFKHPDTIPVALTDVFIGTFLWLSNPVKTMQMNQMQIIAHAYLAFQPDMSLLAKLTNTVNDLLEKDVIDADTCYTLKSNKLVLDKLTQRTLGDPNAFTADTPLDIIAEIRNEGRLEALDELNEQRTRMQEEYTNKMKEEQERYTSEKSMLEDQLVILLTGKKMTKEKRLSDLHNYERMAQRYKSIWAKAICVLIILSAVITFGGIFWLWKLDSNKDTLYLPLATALIPAVIWFVGYIISLIMSKKVMPIEVINWFLEKRYSKKCSKLGCSRTEIEALKDEIQKLETDICTHNRDDKNYTSKGA